MNSRELLKQAIIYGLQKEAFLPQVAAMGSRALAAAPGLISSGIKTVRNLPQTIMNNKLKSAYVGATTFGAGDMMTSAGNKLTQIAKQASLREELAKRIRG